MNPRELFTPAWYLRSGMVQTVMNSNGLRRRGDHEMELSAVEEHLDTGDAVLQAFVSLQASPKGLVILLHGWEGSHHSAYIMSTARFLFDEGYDVCRLNLRDHGTSHHLNEGLFLGTLIEESHLAVRAIAEKWGKGKVYLMGYSMGANFALRMAVRHEDFPVPGLQKILSINPPLDPHNATERIDEYKLIRAYFMRNWKRSLLKKQQLFPHLYDFSAELEMKSCMAITHSLIPRLSPYNSAEEYFSHYTITTEFLKDVTVPLRILTSRNDPIIDATPFENLQLSPSTELIIQNHGGHCGYLMDRHLEAWYWLWLPDYFS